MNRKSIAFAVAAALMTSGAAYAQVKGPDTGVTPSGPSGTLGGGLPGTTCSSAGGSNCTAAIPDFSDPNPGTLTSTMGLQGCGTLTDVNVGVDISHTWVGDLILTVRSPNNTPVIVIDRPGTPPGTFGCSGNDILAVLDDEAGSPVEDECGAGVPTISGSFTPNNALSSLDGLSGDGTWTLEISDNAGGDTGSLNDWSIQCNDQGGDPEPERSIAYFAVDKFFNDGNPGDVGVEITCNTGLPLTQPAIISQGDGVNFVVTDFEDGALDCEIVETSGQDGYATSYSSNGQGTANSCVFTSVAFGTQNTCVIQNNLEAVDVEVTKWWMDENPQFNAQNYAEANYSCVNEVFTQVSGSLQFLGDGDTAGFSVYPDWDGTTTCTVTESLVDSGVETDDSECGSLSVTPGNGATCNIYNTRLYEGIPTLSQYGLTIMALLMMGVGFLAFRRYS